MQDANAESKTVLQVAVMKGKRTFKVFDSQIIFWVSVVYWSIVIFMDAELKIRMEKDIDEVLRVARSVKSKLEELDKDVWCSYLNLFWPLNFDAEASPITVELF